MPKTVTEAHIEYQPVTVYKDRTICQPQVVRRPITYDRQVQVKEKIVEITNKEERKLKPEVDVDATIKAAVKSEVETQAKSKAIFESKAEIK